MENRVKFIAEKFSIPEHTIEYIPGNRDLKTNDTYTFYYNKAVSFNTINILVKAIPNIRLNDSIILDSKIVLRCN